MIHVIAVLTAHAGKRAELLAAFNANVPAVHAEAGCIEYAAHVDADGFGAAQTPLGPETFIVIEKWENADALKAHARSPHMAAYAAVAKDLLAARAVHILS